MEKSLELSSRVRYRTVDDEGVLVHLDTGRVVVVNSVGLHIVKVLNEPITQRQIIWSMVDAFQVTKKQAEKDLKNFLSQLRGEQLLQKQPTINELSSR